MTEGNKLIFREDLELQGHPAQTVFFESATVSATNSVTEPRFHSFSLLVTYG